MPYKEYSYYKAFRYLFKDKLPILIEDLGKD
jgi:hypothetical protein